MKKNMEIEGLRGLTILMILCFHIFCRYGQLYSSDLSSNILYLNYWGQVGVGIFFIISAYFIVSINKKQSSFEYVKNKIMRLWPMYVVAITIIFILTLFLKLPNRECSFWDYLLNLFFVNGFIGTNYIDGAHWYLTNLIGCILAIGVMMYFKLEKSPKNYLIWLIICIILKMIVKLFGLGLFNIPYRLLGGDYVGIVILGILLKFYHSNSKNIVNIYTFLLICVSIVYSYVFTQLGHLIGACIGLFLVSLCIKGKLKFFENKFFLFFGSISYFLYLCHQNISYMIIYNLPSGINYYIKCIMAIVVVVLLSVVMKKVDNKIRKRD